MVAPVEVMSVDGDGIGVVRLCLYGCRRLCCWRCSGRLGLESGVMVCNRGRGGGGRDWGCVSRVVEAGGGWGYEGRGR